MLPPGSLRGSLQLLGVDEPAWVLLPAQPFCSETRGPSIVLWGKMNEFHGLWEEPGLFEVPSSLTS